MNNRLNFICQDCGNSILSYKNDTSTRRKCCKCGSYHIKQNETAAQSENSKELGILKENRLEPFPFVSIVIVNHNGQPFLADCFNSILELDYPKEKIETIMVDNCSHDNSLGFVSKEYSWVKAIANTKNNYCMANNIGIQNSSGKYIILLNNDTRVDKNWLKGLVEAMNRHPDAGAVGSKVYFENGLLQSTGHQEYPNFEWGDRGYNEKDVGQYETEEQMDSLCGASVMYRKECLDEVGLQDEDFAFYLEEVDLALRMKKKGWKHYYTPYSKVIHKYNGTGKLLNPNNPNKLEREYIERNRLLLVAKHFPKNIATALSTFSHFYVDKDFRVIYDTLPLVVSKVIKHHKSEDALAILPHLFDSLRKIIHFEKSALIKELALTKDRTVELECESQRLIEKFEKEKKEEKEKIINDLQEKAERELKKNLEFMNNDLEALRKKHLIDLDKTKEHFEEENKKTKEFYKNLILENEKNSWEKLKKLKEVYEIKILETETEAEKNKAAVYESLAASEKITAKLKEAEDNLKNATELLWQKQNEINQYQQNIKEQEKQQNQLIEIEHKQSQHIQKQEKKIELLIQESDEKLKKAAETIEQKQNEITQYQQNIKEQEKQQNQLIETEQKQSQHIQKQETEIRDLKEKISQQQEQASQLNKQMRQIIEEKEQLTKENEQKINHAQNLLQQKQNELEQKTTQLKQQINTNEQETTQLKTQLKQQITENEQEIKQKNTELQSLAEQITQLQEERKQLQGQILQQSEQISQLQEQLQGEQGHAQELSRVLEQKNAELTKLSSDLDTIYSSKGYQFLAKTKRIIGAVKVKNASHN